MPFYADSNPDRKLHVLSLDIASIKANVSELVLPYIYIDIYVTYIYIYTCITYIYIYIYIYITYDDIQGLSSMGVPWFWGDLPLWTRNLAGAGQSKQS